MCKYLIENRIANEDLFVDFDEEILIYNEFEWDLNSQFTEVTLKDYTDRNLLLLTLNILHHNFLLPLL